MRSGRFSLLLLVIIFCSAWASPVSAGWFGSSSEGEKSGLDLQGGYDRNTVLTVTGKIARVITDGPDGPMLAELRQVSGLTILILGPQAFWQTNGVPLHEGGEVTARGSQAMGRDGRSYLIVEKLTVDGTDIRLRSEAGRPAWSGGSMDRQRSLQMRQQFRGGRPGR